MDPLWSNFFRKKGNEDSLSHFLASVPIFAELGKRDLLLLESLVHQRRYAAAETVFDEGDPGSGMYLIRSGRVQIYCRNRQGREEELALLGPGDFFGETTLTSPIARAASARALDHTELIGLFRADLLATTQKYPALTNKILLGLTRVVSERLQLAVLELRQMKNRLEEASAPKEPLP